MKKTKKAPTDEKMMNGMPEAILGATNFGEQVNQVTSLFKNTRWYMISNMRQILSEMYVEQGLVQTVIDVPVDDAFRGGIKITTKQLDEDQIHELDSQLEEDGELETAAEATKWTRLFGGGAVVIMTEQDPEMPLDMNAINPDTKLEFRAVDLWELFYDQQDAKGYNIADQTENFSHYSYYGIKLHKSRVLRMQGKKAPSFVRPRMRGWGFSVIEALVKSINQYLKAINVSYEVLDEFKIDVYRIKGLTNTLLMANGEEKVKRRVAMSNAQKNYQSAITMDADDEYQQKQLSFSGLAEVQTGIRMQVAADLRMPLTKIFGISATGFSSGEDDIENYNAMVESTVRKVIKKPLIKIVQLKCQKMFGFVPTDLSIDFEPLRVLSTEQEENVKTQKYARLKQNVDGGLMSVKEFKEAVNKGKLLDVQLDTSVDKLETSAEGESDGGVPAPAAKKSVTAAKEAKS